MFFNKGNKMKETIKQIHQLKDLTDQFFCYVNENVPQLIFSKYMINLEGWKSYEAPQRIPKLENALVYFNRTEEYGCPIFIITSQNSIDSIFLGNGLMNISIALNEVLSDDFDIKPNPDSQIQP